MEKLIFEQLKNELVNGASKKGHPFRYFSLATTNAANEPQLRTVVLRKVSQDLELFFYTDYRSNKINQLVANESVAALFYHSKKLMQVQIQGKAEIVKDDARIKSLWNGIPLNSRKDYTTIKAPGSSLKNSEEVDYLLEKNHFCVIKIVPASIEYLRLQRPNHIRVRFNQKSNEWNGQFLVP